MGVLSSVRMKGGVSLILDQDPMCCKLLMFPTTHFFLRLFPTTPKACPETLVGKASAGMSIKGSFGGLQGVVSKT